ncbi:hypothetical protein [Nonomuraea angiospora]|uniref:hypothetical protein n=1 Tax=Nonomuraea angiospora TaxID=46172 RepID=UPI0029A6C30E|nr:hypothetical protein [Nonomuraea angiospora]MDX3099985.1 hypothetical protein [Nonomuraea angiospora]
MSVLAMVSGGLITFGLLIVMHELMPGPPRLGVALARLDGRPAPARGDWLRRRLAQLPIPRNDLALLGISTDRFTVQRISFLLIGLLFTVPLSLLCALAELPLPWAIPAGASVVLAAPFALIPGISARRQAQERRREFRAALATYLDMVALERAAGAGPPQALQAPVDVCTGWMFGQISQVLQQAKRSGEQPWRGLATLGERVGISQLTELADIAEDARSEGTRVMSTLLAKAQSMRTAALADARAQANSRTSEMPIAIGVSIFGFLVLVCFPAIYRIMS